MAQRLISNNTPRAIYGSYMSGGTVSQYIFKPGINEVPEHILALLLAQPGFQEELDNGNLSGKKGDLAAGRDIAEAAAAGKGTDAANIPPPLKTGNQKNAGPSISNSMDEAAKLAAKDAEDANKTAKKKKTKKKNRKK